jgi:ribonuclease P protein component
VKRLFREIFRRNQHAIPAGLDLVMVARRSAHGVDQASLEKIFLKLVEKLREDAPA